MAVTDQWTLAGIPTPLTYGNATLVSGTIVVAGVAGHTGLGRVIFSRVALGGGNVGDIIATLDSVAETITFLSSEATDAGSIDFVCVG